jgi:DNA-binding NarL/FixJ family response regulator
MKNNLMIAGPNREKILSWMTGLKGFVKISVITENLNILLDDVVRTKPEVLLLDFDLFKLNGSNDIAQLRKLCMETRAVVLSGAISEDVEWNLFKAGARGCCRNDIEPELLYQVVMAVNQGELWVRRSLACRLVDELGKTTSKNKAYQAALGLLNNLTQREYDIAVRIGNGESNKQIAKSCGITERTVKAHLTEVYHKLGVTDRLNLALIISAGDHDQQRDKSLFQ